MGNSCKSVCSVNLYLLLESIRFKFTKMKTFEKEFSLKTKLETLDKYIRSILKKNDPDDEIEVYIQEFYGKQIVNVKILDRILH